MAELGFILAVMMQKQHSVQLQDNVGIISKQNIYKLCFINITSKSSSLIL